MHVLNYYGHWLRWVKKSPKLTAQERTLSKRERRTVRKKRLIFGRNSYSKFVSAMQGYLSHGHLSVRSIVDPFMDQEHVAPCAEFNCKGVGVRGCENLRLTEKDRLSL